MSWEVRGRKLGRIFCIIRSKGNTPKEANKGNKVVVGGQRGLRLGWTWELELLVPLVCAQPFALSTVPALEHTTFNAPVQCSQPAFAHGICVWSESRQAKAEKCARAETTFKAQIEKCLNSLILLNQKAQLFSYNQLLLAAFSNSTGSKGWPKWHWVKLRWGRNSTSFKDPAQHYHH